MASRFAAATGSHTAVHAKLNVPVLHLLLTEPVKINPAITYFYR
jgi:hypothetical protein